MQTLLLLATVVSTASAEDANPLGKVLQLMDELAAKVTAEGEAAQKAYHDYYEWCDETAANTANEIKAAKAAKQKLEASITKHTSDIETATSKIEDLSGAIASSESELKEATKVREKEAAVFVASEKELADVVDTLGRAIDILEREASKGSSFAQMDKTAMSNLMSSLSAVVDAAAFVSSDKERLVALLQSQDEDADSGAPAAAVYKSHAGGIVEILADMRDKAEEELGELRKTEGNSKHNFQMLKQSLEDQQTQDQKHLDAEKSNKANAAEGRATDEGDLKRTTEDLATAETELEDVRGGCMTVAADYEKTQVSRAEELKVIAQAKQILEETTSGAVSQTYSFVQLSQHNSESQLVAFVKQLAKRHHSAALAQLSSRIAAVVRFESGGRGPFAKVKGMIQDMIEKLEQEGAEAASEKAWCDEQTKKTTAKKDDLESDETKLATKIDQQSSKSASLKDEVKELQEQLRALVSEQAEMDKIRQEQHADYEVVKKDMELGLSGVERALSVLRDYYAKDDSDSDAFVQQPAPPKKFVKAGGAGGSIIGILEVCQSDFATGLSKAETEESDSQAAYDKTTQENKVVKATKEQDVKGKTQEFTGLDKSIAESSSDLEGLRTELDAVNEYLAKVNERCIAKPETYEERKARREAEINGLKEALNILENETALLQRKRGHVRGSLMHE